uniref:Uncharacterized protein n=1 Tax=viral metagenome TaxID=1070528 RepID=A0A6C0EML5_9ZZZZ
MRHSIQLLPPLFLRHGCLVSHLFFFNEKKQPLQVIQVFLCSFDILQWHEASLNSSDCTGERLLELNNLKGESVITFSHQSYVMDEENL